MEDNELKETTPLQHPVVVQSVVMQNKSIDRLCGVIVFVALLAFVAYSHVVHDRIDVFAATIIGVGLILSFAKSLSG